MADPIQFTNITNADHVKHALEAEKSMLEDFIADIEKRRRASESRPSEKDWLNCWQKDLEDNLALNSKWLDLLETGDEKELAEETQLEAEMLEEAITIVERYRSSSGKSPVANKVLSTWIDDFESDKLAAEAIADALKPDASDG